MDATSGPLNWLPTGITSLILSLERADSLAVQFKAFSVTQTVKSLLSCTKTSGGGLWETPNPPLPKGFHRFFSPDALRELMRPTGVLGIHGISMHGSTSHLAARCPCFCDGDEVCDCHHSYGGCGDLDCALCESCTSEEECDDECEEHHGLCSTSELQYQWGYPLEGYFLSSGPIPYSSRCGERLPKARRDSRVQGFGSKDWHVQKLGGSSLAERRTAIGVKDYGERLGAQDNPGWKRGGLGEAPLDPAVKATHKMKDVKENFECRSSSQDGQDLQLSEDLTEKDRAGRQSGDTERHASTRSKGANYYVVGKALRAAKQCHKNSAGPEIGAQEQAPSTTESATQRKAIDGLPSGNQAVTAVGGRETAGRNAESDNSLALQTNKWNFRMGQNAIAGALAGGFVSLCLHPIDTLKTVVQSQTGGNRNLLSIFSSIISQRGIKGLYRGLGSNLASSAPTSAIYTLTYEAVKAGLLRNIPMDMSALAHCAAGGCASVATSIVYTPSECVKQQMQVNLLYRNSWLSFTGLLKQGGLPMLYNGWGAVLCRNVPQSVIKFYTYEGLKLWVQGGQPSGIPLSTMQTLAIGGVAGSTAAFFTTPFDVVKTRLQTQIPGTLQQYNGVFHAFQCIAAKEGVSGLYRGLVPRLVIYVTQGALFFASYEFIKHVLAVEVPRMHIKTSQSENHHHGPVPIPTKAS